MYTMKSLVAFLQCFLLLLSATPSYALKIGVQTVGQGGAPAGSQQCSRTCESEHCTVPPFLRYGKYCGILYTGCPGEKPCDALDACCMVHDHCVDANNNDYLNTECNENLLNCVATVQQAGPTFPGNKCTVGEVAGVIKTVIEAAILAGKVLHKREMGQ